VVDLPATVTVFWAWPQRDWHQPQSLVGRYYDPVTGQFLSVDPDLVDTGQPYAFTGDDPLNETDPLGMMVDQGPGEPIAGVSAASANKADKIQREDLANAVISNSGAAYAAANSDLPSLGHLAVSVERFAVDLPQDAFYLAYWGTYEAGSHIVSVGCSYGTAGCVYAHAAVLPLVPAEAVGLAGDIFGNALKGEPLAQGENPNTPLLGNDSIAGIDLGRVISNALDLPSVKFPGYDANTHNIQFAWWLVLRRLHWA
jgi:RHS repeat-associated protein